MATRFLIGKGELLTYDIPAPPIVASKVHPYTLREAQLRLIPQLVAASGAVKQLSADACPSEIAVVKFDLHPAYIAKSYFPAAFLRQAGLSTVGSRTIKVRPRTELRRTAGEVSESTQLFVAGTRKTFERLPSYAEQLVDQTREAIQFAEFEDLAAMTSSDRVRGTPGSDDKTFEVGLHLIPDQGVEPLRSAFAAFAKRRGFKINTEFDFPVGRMLFMAATGNVEQLQGLAEFSLLRVVRPMPELRGHRPFVRSAPIRIGFTMPTLPPVLDEPKVAILDGGLPEDHVLGTYVRKYELSDPTAGAVADYLDHGLGVTSAFLFGPIEPSGTARRPFAFVDHYRVLDEKAGDEDEYELYRTLAHIEEVLLSRQYQFLNLSLGPDLPIEDDDVHAWTAVLDTLLSDGGTMMTVAVGNNGERNADMRLNRVQVPSDSVNALSIGAADRSGDSWSCAGYSARGPGRSPGRRKPDVVSFGGSPKDYFHVPQPGRRPQLAGTMGTSFAAPYALRTAVGVRAVLGEAVQPLTIKALIVHAAHNVDDHPVDGVGWGRVPQDINELIVCGDGVARIIYQGLLRPGKYLRAPVPLPHGVLTGMVNLTATFCYASPVDVEDAAAYTKAGLSITFRPHEEKSSGRNATSKSFFSTREFRTEQEQRSDLGKWETVLHASRRMRGSSLSRAAFDIHYNARDGGGSAGQRGELIAYSLVLTVEAPKHANLYEDILAAHVSLEAIEPRISIPLRNSLGTS